MEDRAASNPGQLGFLDLHALRDQYGVLDDAIGVALGLVVPKVEGRNQSLQRGFIGLLQQMQQIRNTEDSLNAQVRTLALLEANLEGGLIDIAQVDQFRQNIETERANLLQAQNSLASSLDSFNTSTLGLPPDVPIEPDDTLIQPFQLISPSMTAVQTGVYEVLDAFGELPEEPERQALEQTFERIVSLTEMDKCVIS